MSQTLSTNHAAQFVLFIFFSNSLRTRQRQLLHKGKRGVPVHIKRKCIMNTHIKYKNATASGEATIIHAKIKKGSLVLWVKQERNFMFGY